MKLERTDKIIAVAFLLPTLALISLLVFYPIGETILISLGNVGPRYQIEVGFEVQNYLNVFLNPVTSSVISNSLVLTAAVVSIDTIVGIFAAKLLNQKLRGRALFRGIMILPWALPGIVVGYLWLFMFDPLLGLVNSFLMGIGLMRTPFPWFDNPVTAMLVIILGYVWEGSAFMTLMSLAALQSVPEEQLDAAQMDGAGFWRKLLRIELPHMSSTLKIAALLAVFWTFNYFEMVWITTGGGPFNSTYIFPVYIYQKAFASFDFVSASVYSVLDFVILLGIGTLFIKLWKVL